jgi:hypothetical protein
MGNSVGETGLAGKPQTHFLLRVVQVCSNGGAFKRKPGAEMGRNSRPGMANLWGGFEGGTCGSYERKAAAEVVFFEVTLEIGRGWGLR